MYTTVTTTLVRAARAEVYSALLDPRAVARWRVPAGMTAEVHDWEAEVGGRFRVSLTYRGDESGKSGAHTDTYAGRFVELVPDEKVVEVLAFETGDPELASPMTMTTTLRDREDATEVELVHDGVPDSVRPEDNELGSRMALANLAAYVEAAGAAG